MGETFMSRENIRWSTFLARSILKPQNVAFDKVCSTVAERDRSEFVKELIARRVIALAERGERDPDKLAEAVTSSLELHRRAMQ
jgi:hypothetical protein